MSEPDTDDHRASFLHALAELDANHRDACTSRSVACMMIGYAAGILRAMGATADDAADLVRSIVENDGREPPIRASTWFTERLSMLVDSLRSGQVTVAVLEAVAIDSAARRSMQIMRSDAPTPPPPTADIDPEKLS